MNVYTIRYKFKIQFALPKVKSCARDALEIQIGAAQTGEKLSNINLDCSTYNKIGYTRHFKI